MNPSPIRCAAAALVVFCTALAALGTPAAYAHEGEGILKMESQGEAESATVPYAVRLTWANDGHPAVDATVTATPIDPSGSPQTPVPMQFEGQDGRYTGTVTFPTDGTWTVRFTSVIPGATMEILQEVAAPPPSTPTPSSTTTTAAEEPPGPDAPDTEEASAVGEPADDEDGVNGLILGAFLAVILAVGVALVMRARKSRSVS